MYYTVFCYHSLFGRYVVVGDRMTREAAGALRQMLELDDHDVEVLGW